MLSINRILVLSLAAGVSTLADAALAETLETQAATVKTWSFNGTNGGQPLSSVFIDRSGNIIGTTSGGGDNNLGTVFILKKNATGYWTIISTIMSFNGTNGSSPNGNLIADSSGALLGTTYNGGTNSAGVVFKIAKGTTGYAKTPTVLYNFGSNSAYPYGGLISDSSGNLFGTTSIGGTDGSGIIYEILKTSTGYAKTINILASFSSSTGTSPNAGLTMDTKGNIFGTTLIYGTYSGGTVYKLAKGTSGYSKYPIALHNFTLAASAGGFYPHASLSIDSSGNIFGTTFNGGNGNYSPAGTVFELKKSSSAFAFKQLVSFNAKFTATYDLRWTYGRFLYGNLIVDKAGNLYGTASSGGQYDCGTVFKIAKTATGYATTPTVLVTFKGNNGKTPSGGLVADANGNLWGTTKAGGGYDQGTIFEVLNSGYVK